MLDAIVGFPFSPSALWVSIRISLQVPLQTSPVQARNQTIGATMLIKKCDVSDYFANRRRSRNPVSKAAGLPGAAGFPAPVSGAIRLNPAVFANEARAEHAPTGISLVSPDPLKAGDPA
jgi:hypothetical protein